MSDSLVHRLVEAIAASAHDRHKLILVLGSFGTGKTRLLQATAAEIEGVRVNLNLVLAERLLQLPRSRYADGVTVHQEIDQLCNELSRNEQPLLVDNVEMLFSPQLGQVNPVDTFKRVSRQRPIILALAARRDGNHAEYSTLGRSDYLRMEIGDYVVIDLEAH
jgi:chromosomal replication initiation ATPase DnaA